MLLGHKKSSPMFVTLMVFVLFGFFFQSSCTVDALEQRPDLVQEETTISKAPCDCETVIAAVEVFHERKSELKTQERKDDHPVAAYAPQALFLNQAATTPTIEIPQVYYEDDQRQWFPTLARSHL